jgi:hypothetical protein
MDADQVQQQMKERRAAIDAKLDQLRQASRAAAQRSAGRLFIAASLTVATIIILRQVASRRRRRPAGILRLAKSG